LPASSNSKNSLKNSCIYKLDHHQNLISWCYPYIPLLQQAQLMLTNTRDAIFRGLSKSPNLIPFDMLNMVSY